VLVGRSQGGLFLLPPRLPRPPGRASAAGRPGAATFGGAARIPDSLTANVARQAGAGGAWLLVAGLEAVGAIASERWIEMSTKIRAHHKQEGHHP
jgi:hypothetical protein